MNQLQSYYQEALDAGAQRFVISKPVSGQTLYKKITVEKKNGYYQIARYTQTQVYHENLREETLLETLVQITQGQYLQVNGFASDREHILLISRKGVCSYKRKALSADPAACAPKGHNREKKYLLAEGTVIPPLVDMGVFTRDGKVVNAMYDKYRQINRFLEILDDEIDSLKADRLNVIDFGCGKSYLTFVVYYYLTQIKGIQANMIGLDLKADVIRKCSETALKYGYSGLKFDLGDISGYQAPFDVDLVITLHACDTATDHALFNAIRWNARMIFSVPCCQHELNWQIRAKNLTLLTHYPILKERFSALATDAIRGNLLEYCGYKTQLLEFIDFAHTPKNILIRAVKRPITPKAIREKALDEVKALMEEFGFTPTLYTLLGSPEE